MTSAVLDQPTDGAVDPGPIITPDRRLRIFVSSTLDLVEEREATRRAIESLHLAPVMFEAGARSHPPRALYRSYLAQSDVFVAVYSRRYGWVAPDMEISGLEDEFLLSNGMPRLVYIEADAPREPELDAFLERVQAEDLSYRRFRSVDELADLVESDLAALLTERFHAGASPGRRPQPANLPNPPGPLVGRDDELATISALLTRTDVRLVTLTGPGGIGKTRLALAAAHHARDAYASAYFVELAPVTDESLVAATIAEALDAAAADSTDPVRLIADRLGAERALLVLDNFEQLTAAAPVVTDLLEACPGLTALVTSRAPLRVLGEQDVDLAPLATTSSAGDSAPPSAVQLFTALAEAQAPGFRARIGDLDVVAEICRRLDGLPLAIELAAGTTRILSPEMILHQLDEHLTDFGHGRRDMPDRHRTLRSTIEWSWQLLDAESQHLFVELAIFPAAFTLERVAQICTPTANLLDVLSALVEHSLLRVRHSPDGPSFSMLATIRHFADERLAQSGERDALLDRHAQVFLDVAHQVGCPRGRHHTGLDGVEAQLDDLRQALGSTLERGGADRVARALGDSWWFWWLRGYVQEGRMWTARTLDSPTLAAQQRTPALFADGMFALWSGDYHAALARFEETATLAELAGDRRHGAYADVGAGLVAAATGDAEAGSNRIHRGIDTFERIGDEIGAITGLAADTWTQAMTRSFDETDETLREALRRARSAGSEVEIGIVEAAHAQFHLVHGDTGAAVQYLEAALHRLTVARHIGSTMITLEVIAEVVIDNEPDTAASILAAAAGIREVMGTAVPPSAARRTTTLIAQARAALGDGFETAWARGADLNLTEASSLGTDVLGRLRPSV